MAERAWFLQEIARNKPNLESGPIAIFGLKIVQELWDKASKRPSQQAQIAPYQLD
jgi:hypothetical protein